MYKVTAARLAEKWIFVEIHFVNNTMVVGFVPHHQFKSLQMEVDRGKGYTLTFLHEYEGQLIAGQLVFNNQNIVYMKAYRRGTQVFDSQADLIETLQQDIEVE